MASPWILFLWISGSSPTLPPAATTQEFATREQCAKVAYDLHRAIGDHMNFLCVEKDPQPKAMKQSRKDKRKK